MPENARPIFSQTLPSRCAEAEKKYLRKLRSRERKQASLRMKSQSIIKRPPGQYTVVCHRKGGYSPAIQSVNLRSGATETLSLTPQVNPLGDAGRSSVALAEVFTVTYRSFGLGPGGNSTIGSADANNRGYSDRVSLTFKGVDLTFTTGAASKFKNDYSRFFGGVGMMFLQEGADIRDSGGFGANASGLTSNFGIPVQTTQADDGTFEIDPQLLIGFKLVAGYDLRLSKTGRLGASPLRLKTEFWLGPSSGDHEKFIGSGLARETFCDPSIHNSCSTGDLIHGRQDSSQATTFFHMGFEFTANYRFALFHWLAADPEYKYINT